MSFFHLFQLYNQVHDRPSGLVSTVHGPQPDQFRRPVIHSPMVERRNISIEHIRNLTESTLMFYFVLIETQSSSRNWNSTPLSRSVGVPPSPKMLTDGDPAMTVFVQRPGEAPEIYEQYGCEDMALACRLMLQRSEPLWVVWTR